MDEAEFRSRHEAGTLSKVCSQFVDLCSVIEHAIVLQATVEQLKVFLSFSSLKNYAIDTVRRS